LLERLNDSPNRCNDFAKTDERVNEMPRNKATKIATLHRMVMSDRMCPHGLKSKDLLEREGYEVEDRHLTSREEVDAFKTKHGLATTPQTFIDGVRIGGFDDLREYFGKPTKARDTLTYTPVIMLFSVAAFMALAVTWVALGTPFSGRTIEWFISISMVLRRDMGRAWDTLLWTNYRMVYLNLHGAVGVTKASGCRTLCDHVSQL